MSYGSEPQLDVRNGGSPLTPVSHTTRFEVRDLWSWVWASNVAYRLYLRGALDDLGRAASSRHPHLRLTEGLIVDMMLANTILTYVISLLAFAYASAVAEPASQTIFTQNAHTEYDAGLFTPLGDLSLLSATEFTRLAHPAFPRHSARIKQSQFCNETAR